MGLGTRRTRDEEAGKWGQLKGCPHSLSLKPGMRVVREVKCKLGARASAASGLGVRGQKTTRVGTGPDAGI